MVADCCVDLIDEEVERDHFKRTRPQKKIQYETRGSRLLFIFLQGRREEART